jgi:hypothetical protein
MTARVQLKKKSGREAQGAWRQDELIGGKPPVVKWLDFDFEAKYIHKRQNHPVLRGCYITTMTAMVQLQKNKISGLDPQWAWRQGELIDGKPPAVKWLTMNTGSREWQLKFEVGSWKPVSSPRELQRKGAGQRVQEPLDTETHDATLSQAIA